MKVDTAPGALPLVEPLQPALGPAELFQRLSCRPGCLFLDSSLRHPQLGRYSFLAVDPYEWIEVGPQDDVAAALERLRAELNRVDTPARSDLPPFQGGAAGLFGYELAHTFEQLPQVMFDEFDSPALAVGLYDIVIAFDHQQGQAWIVSQGFPELDELARRQRARQRLLELKEWIERPLPTPTDDRMSRVRCDLAAPVRRVVGHGELLSNFSPDEYFAAVAQVIDYIRAGDIFQANLSQRLLHPQQTDSVSLFFRLRQKTQSTFAAYFDTGSCQVISASPERFLQVRDRQVETRPIKGTRPSMPGPLAEMYSGRELLTSEKDRAENVMIVDLLRNDISQACQPHSVTVPVLCGLEAYGYVQHLVSVVHGELRPECQPLDLLAAAFPGGSVTGAPKIRAMEIITELERVPRGAYCGSLGYLSCTGDMDTNILIRTITAAGGWWQLPVGGGIVVDSDPQREFEETWHKATGVLRAIDGN
jgi:para-aminobenzoate synthetase component 1